MPSTRYRLILPSPGSVLYGRTAIVVAALLWSTIGLARSFLPVGADPLSVAAARALLGGVVFAGLYARPARAAPLLRRGCRWPVLVAAFALAANQALYFCAMSLAGVAVGVVVAMGSIPVFAGILALVTRSGQLSWRWALATACAVGACVVLALDHRAGGPHAAPAGILCGAGAGLSYAVFTRASRAAIRRGGDSRTAMALTVLGGGLVLSPLLLLRGGGAGWLLTCSGQLVIAYIALVATVLAYVLYGRGLRTTAPTTAATLVLAEPVGAVLVGVVVLAEPLTGRSLAGLVLLAVALAILAPHRRTAYRPRPLTGRARRYPPAAVSAHAHPRDPARC